MNPISYFVLISLAFSLSAPVFAESDCGWNSDHTLYSGCNGQFASFSGGGASPRVAESLETNPASLPIVNAPLGIEGSYTNRSAPHGKSKLSASTVKGFDGVGFGIGSWSEGTFEAPDFANHFLSSASLAEYKKYQNNPPSTFGLRLGTSIGLPKLFFPKGVQLSIGGSAGLGRVSGDWSPQVGILMKIRGLGLGYSNSFERISTTLPAIRISTFAIGMQLSNLYIGYSYFILKSIVNKSYANVYGLRLTIKKLTLYGSVKQQRDHRRASDIWISGGALRQFGKRIGLGYEYGLYRYSHTALLQIYL